MNSNRFAPIALGLAAVTSSAETLNINFEGYVSAPPEVYYLGFKPDSRFSASISFDTSSQPISDSGTRGIYPANVRYAIAGDYVSTAGQVSAISIFNAAFDEFDAAARLTPVNSYNGNGFLYFDLELKDFSGTVYSSTSLPTSVDLAPFQQVHVTLMFGTSFGSEADWMVPIDVFSVSVVPELSVWTLFSVGLLTLTLTASSRFPRPKTRNSARPAQPLGRG